MKFSASSGSGTVWGTDSASGISNTSSTTVTFPKLTPLGTGELYFGYTAVANAGAAGSTSSFSYATTSDADVASYNTNVSAPVQPTAKQSPAGISGGVAVLLTASPSSSSVTVPGPPVITSVVPGNGQLTVHFTPGSNGGSPFTSFTVTCGGLNVSASGSATSATVSQLTNGTQYSCTVSASNVERNWATIDLCLGHAVGVNDGPHDHIRRHVGQQERNQRHGPDGVATARR